MPSDLAHALQALSARKMRTAMETILPRILCVDDEPRVLDALARQLRQQFSVVTAIGGEAGLATIAAQEPFAVVVSDMRMPGMNGAEFLQHVRQRAADTTRVLLTGQTDLGAAIAAVNQGNIFRFLSKPCPPEVLVPALRAAVEQYRLVNVERDLLEQTLRGCVQALADVLALANPAAFGRSTRVKQYTVLLAEQLAAPDRWQLEVAAMLSQIGCVTLPPATQAKLYHRQAMSSSESEMVERLPATAAQLVASIPRLETIRDILAYQDKRYDGSGNPKDAVRGDQIPLGARLLKIVLDYDALETQGTPAALTIDTLRGRAGWYDPVLLAVLPAALGRAAGGASVLEVGLRDVRVGMVFAEDVMAKNGMLLIARGQKVTSSLLERVRNFSEKIGIVEPIRVIVGESADKTAA
jgi:response regulator RpfG family c-di-GMP phosphodiesterase